MIRHMAMVLYDYFCIQDKDTCYTRVQALAEAKKSIQCDWQDLLPVAAQMNLKAALKLQRMQQLLKNSSEVAINLDQDVGVQDRSVCEGRT